MQVCLVCGGTHGLQKSHQSTLLFMRNNEHFWSNLDETCSSEQDDDSEW